LLIKKQFGRGSNVIGNNLMHWPVLVLRRGEMTIEQPVWSEAPLWLVIALILLGGLAGEMLRADKDGVRGWSLFRRLFLRSGSSMICGASAIMLLHAAGVSIWVACAGGCLTAMAGTDVVIGLYERWAAKHIGVTGRPPGDAEN
jgi:hypothetical protein